MLDSFHILFLSVWSSVCPPLCTRDSRITDMTDHLNYSTSKNDANAPGGDVFYLCLQYVAFITDLLIFLFAERKKGV